jgi:hypothetical protein
MRSNWKSVFPDRYLPAPIPFRRTSCGVEVPSPANARPSDSYSSLWQRPMMLRLAPQQELHTMPYDTYCPSLQTEVKIRVCKFCNVYFPSQAAKARHIKLFHEVCNVTVDQLLQSRKDRNVWDMFQNMSASSSCPEPDTEEDPECIVDTTVQAEDSAPIFENISRIMQCPWTRRFRIISNFAFLNSIVNVNSSYHVIT